MDNLIRNLKHLIIETLNLEETAPDDIDEAAPLFGEGLGLDSIDALELVVMLEKHFSIRITDIEVGRKVFSSVNSMAKFIAEKQKG